MTTIESVMTRDVRRAHPGTTLVQAAGTMAEINAGSLPVCEGSRLIGVVTDRDIVVRGVAAGLEPARATVTEVMTGDVHTAQPGDSVETVLARMAELQIRRLPVVDAQRHLVGIVSLGDLAVRQNKPVEETLTKISEPAPEDRAAS